jgi:hypothetical protein
MLPIILIVAVTLWLAVIAVVLAICASAGRGDRYRASKPDAPRGQRMRLVA